MSSIITIAEFNKRLPVLCLGGVGQGFPRKDRDQQILFRSVTMTLDGNHEYSESELNDALMAWLRDIGQAIELDHVSLRRYLVDAGYLMRDAAGSSYRIDSERLAGLFEAGIENVDPLVLLGEARIRIEERRRQHSESRA